MRLSRALVAAAAACSLAACGSTVQDTGTSAGGPPGEATTGLVAPGTTGGSSGPGTTGQPNLPPGQASTGATIGPGGTTGATTGGAGSATGTTRAPVVGGPVTGRGFTRTTIQIGVYTADDFQAFTKALGADNLNTGDAMAQYNAVVADINKHGGIAGRKIVLVKHNYNTAQVLNDPETANEAACATWTQDNHVFAVALPGGIFTRNLLECLKKHDTPLIFGGGVESPRTYQAIYTQYPLLFNPGAMLAERFDEVSIRRLVARGFFTGWDTLNGRPSSAPVKIGAVFRDTIDGETKKRSIERQLHKYGLTLASVVRCPASFSDAIRCQQASVLRMQADGVTHMLGAGAFFLTTAEGQHYRPRYFIDQTAKSFASLAPHPQLVGAMSESTIPLMDVEQPQDPGDPSPATDYCRRIMRASGQTTSDRTTMWSMGSVCDSLYFLRAAVSAGRVLSTAGVRAGFESLGPSVPSALTWSTFFGPQDHASTRGVRDLKFVPETCEGCADGYFAYAGKVTHQAA